MLLTELNAHIRRFQRRVFLSLSAIAASIALTSFFLFGRGVSFVRLDDVISLFALIPVALIALLASVMFRQLNEQVYRQQEGVRALLEATPLGLICMDRRGVVTTINSGMQHLWGLEPGQIVGLSIFDRPVFPSLAVDALLRRALEGKKGEEEIEITAGGKSLWHWFRVVPVTRPDSGDLDFIVVLVQDMTKRKEMELELARHTETLERGMERQVRALKQRTTELETLNANSEDAKRALLNVLEDTQALERKLQEEQNRLQAIVSSIGEGVVVADVHGAITFANTMARNLLEIDPDKIVGANLFHAVEILEGTEKKAVKASAIEKSLKLRSIEQVRMRDDQYWRTPSGRVFPVAFVAAPLLSQEFHGVVVVFRDITEDKQLDEAKTNFISIASHQLRTPLTAIRWLTELLIKEGTGKIDPQLEMYADDIQQSAKRMIVLVNSLLNVSRIESGRINISAQAASVEQLIEGVIKETEIAARGARCGVEFHKPRKALPKIPLDVNLMRQVIQNLVTNAIRYSRPQHCEIVITAGLEGDHILISVKDTGMGIPADAQPRIFEKFFRASNAVKKQTDGTGLGLYISKMIVEMAGGKIWFESQVDRGTTFYVTLPLEGMHTRLGDISLVTAPK